MYVCVYMCVCAQLLKSVQYLTSAHSSGIFQDIQTPVWCKRYSRLFHSASSFFVPCHVTLCSAYASDFIFHHFTQPV